MNRERLIRNLKYELNKIENQENKIYSTGETRYDLMIKDILNYIETNSISKEVIEKKIEELKETLSHYNEYTKLNILEKMNVEILDNKIEVLKELLEEK